MLITICIIGSILQFRLAMCQTQRVAIRPTRELDDHGYYLRNTTTSKLWIDAVTIYEYSHELYSTVGGIHCNGCHS